MAKDFIPERLRLWIEARRRFHLTDAQVQMARELGMNPKHLGKLANADQEPWKLPLPQFIEHLYLKRYRRERPAEVRPLEELAQREAKKKAERRAVRAVRRAGGEGPLVTAIADIPPEAWERYRTLCVDGAGIEPTHAQWLARRDEVAAKLQAQGMSVCLIRVDVEHLATWCRERGAPLDGPARSAYLAEMARRGHGIPVPPPS